MNNLSEINRAGEDLEKSIISNENMEVVFSYSKKIDELIIKRLDKYMKYEKMLNFKDKYIIINSLKQDILKYFFDISMDDLEILSNTLYLFCCLRANDISIDEILEYATFTNQNYSEKTISTNCISIEEEQYTNFYTCICKKYINIIKERITK